MWASGDSFGGVTSSIEEAMELLTIPSNSGVVRRSRPIISDYPIQRTLNRVIVRNLEETLVRGGDSYPSPGGGPGCVRG
ncbi:hypothetical protein NPIL_334291 [Nephila pilipes]|uniref:Uncharacterized protein n=1 Tax=Nephila pilipes TaxID=299642 RepID=A0A8X6MW39_NEPPI|nr:hypothetical protein NPIL_334291 [Nephila pilipes]